MKLNCHSKGDLTSEFETLLTDIDWWTSSSSAGLLSHFRYYKYWSNRKIEICLWWHTDMKHPTLNISVSKTEQNCILSQSFKNSRHLWAAHLRACLLSHHVLPAEPISKFLDCTLLPLASIPTLLCALSQPGQQDLAPHRSLLLHQTTLHQSFLLSLHLCPSLPPEGMIQSPMTQSIF